MPGLTPGYSLRPVSRSIRPLGQFNAVAADTGVSAPNVKNFKVLMYVV